MVTKDNIERWPNKIIYQKTDRLLNISFNTGEEFSMSVEYLRVESPSAEVMGHGGVKKIISGRKYVGITEIEEVGNYGIRIIFDDLHDTGIYSWETLYKLGLDYEDNWKKYLLELQNRGLQRDP